MVKQLNDYSQLVWLILTFMLPFFDILVQSRFQVTNYVTITVQILHD